MPNGYLTSHEVAERMMVHINTVARWSDKGALPFTRTPGGHRRYREQDVADFIAERAAEHARKATA